MTSLVHVLLTEFSVPGLPMPQGSKTTGRTKTGRTFVREDNPGTGPWRNAVAGAAIAAMRGADPEAGPLFLEAVFAFPRPKAHFGTGRNAGTLKRSAPPYCATIPDLDKLLRAVGDACKGIIWRDDSQLVQVRAEKVYGTPGLAATVWELA